MNNTRNAPDVDGILGTRPALSRRDGKTDICSDCGFKEAMEDAEKIIEMNRRENKCS